MAERLRRDAAFLAQAGAEDLAERVRTIADEAEVRGIAESTHNFYTSESSENDERHNLILLTGALARYEKEHPDDTRLSPELAHTINRNFGGLLRDDIPLGHLLLPSKKNVFPITDEETRKNLEAISAPLKARYNRALTPFVDRRSPTGQILTTLGDLRAQQLHSLKLKKVSKTITSFVSTAFAKIPDEELI